MELKEIEEVMEKMQKGEFTLSRMELADELKAQIEKTDELEKKIHALENPRDILCPTCQEVFCDEDCPNPRDNEWKMCDDCNTVSHCLKVNKCKHK